VIAPIFKTLVSSSGKEYNFNIHAKLNALNIKPLLLPKQLRKGEVYDFDYDNQLIEHEKYDAKRTSFTESAKLFDCEF
jgi:hypothetical protein